MAYRNLLVERAGPALRICLNRPEVLNALSLELLDELGHALSLEAASAEVRGVLITGSGRGFCAGADLSSTELGGDIGETLRRHYHPVVSAIAQLDKPVVAAVNGVAAGAGLSLALACDVRWASSAASFALGFTGIGLVMDAGASYYLPRLIGPGRALDLAYGNRRVMAQEALAIGLVERLLPAEGFTEQAWSGLVALASGPTVAYGLAKREIAASAANGLAAQLELEAASQALAAASADAAEGVAAFRQKRAPVFKGR